MDGLMRGPMPIDDFFTEFVPLHGEDWDRRIELGATEMGQAAMFSQEYIRSRFHQLGLCKGQVFLADTYNIPSLAYQDDADRVIRRPHMVALSEKLLDGSASDETRLRDVASLTEWFVDLRSTTQDPFGYYALETMNPLQGLGAREKFIMYGHMMFAHGHRIFGFGLVIMPNTARIIRFDRSNIVFSEQFDWRKHWAVPTFIHRYEHMSRAERGWDISVSRLSLAATQALLNDTAVRDMIDALPKQTVKPLTTVNGALFRFEVWDDEECSLHTLIAGLPQTQTQMLTLAGRSTRGYIAYDAKEKSLLYMKDTFRVTLEGLRKESDVYRVLRRARVPHLPGFLYGGDVPAIHPDVLRCATPPSAFQETAKMSLRQDASASSPSNSVHASWKAYPVPVQATCGTDFNDASWFKKRSGILPDPERTIHHRVVLKKIGRPLRDFESTRQLAVSMCDAVEAHSAAYVAGVLHRDISAGNILIDEKGHGMLIDWELSRFINDTSTAHRNYRMGTWAFMSAELCRDQQPAEHLLRHDFESFVHVLYYHVFRYCKMEGVLPQHIRMTMVDVFEDKRPDGIHYGGQNKRGYLVNLLTAFSQRNVVDISPIPQGLQDLLAETREPFGTFYERWARRMPDDKRQKKEEVLKNLSRPSYFFEDVWKPWVYNDDAWVTDNDPAATDQFPPARIQQCQAPVRRRKPKSKPPSSKRQKLNSMYSAPVLSLSPMPGRLSGANKIAGVDSMSAVTTCRPGNTVELGSKRKFDDIAEEEEEEEDGGTGSESSDDEDDGIEPFDWNAYACQRAVLD